MKDVREILKKRPLLFDGGMGTYYKAKPGQECEQANLLDPDGILTVHRAYLEAGADAIKTNTFGLPRMAAAQNPMWEAMADEAGNWLHRPLQRPALPCLPILARPRTPRHSRRHRSIRPLPSGLPHWVQRTFCLRR